MLLARFGQFCQLLLGMTPQAAPKRRRDDQGRRGNVSDETLGSSTLMIPPPSTGTHAHDLMEGASERRLIREACLLRNVRQRFARVQQEILGTLNPALHEPSVSGNTEARLE